MSDAVHASHFELDLALLGAPRAETERHLAECAHCAADLEARRAAQVAFSASDAPVRAAELILARMSQTARPPRRRWWRALFPLALAGSVALALFARRPVPSEPAIRTKGGPVVQAFVERGAGAARLLKPGEQLEAGDAVQLAYRAAGYRQITVFSVERDCAVHRELSQPTDESRTVERSWQLDAHPAGERLYAVFGDGPLDDEAFAAALRLGGACSPGSAPALDWQGFSARGVVLRSEAK